MLTGTQKRRGFREVLFNHRTNGFYAPMPGDNYEILPIKSGDSDGDGEADGIGIVGGIDEVLAEGNLAAPNQTLRFNDPDLQPLVDAGIIDEGDFNTDNHATANHRALYSRWGTINPVDEYTTQTYISAYGLTLDKPKSDVDWGEYVEVSGSGLYSKVSPRDGTSDEGSLSELSAIRIAMNNDDKFTVTHGGSCKATEFILTSPNGTEYALTVADDGTLSTTAV